MADDHEDDLCDLSDNIQKKLGQAQGICETLGTYGKDDKALSYALWAASELIEAAKEGAHELWIRGQALEQSRVPN